MKEEMITPPEKLNSAKKLRRILYKGKWYEYIEFTKGINTIISYLEETLKLYISCRTFASQNNPIGDGEKENWRTLREFIKKFKEDYLK